MRVGIGNRTWVSTAIITMMMGIGVTNAELPGHLQQAGRIHGFGWGDGYHTCKNSNPRWRDDLPPRPPAAPRGHRLRPNGSGKALASRVGSTFYDRFDAANRGRCLHQGCDRIQCDHVGCDLTYGPAVEPSQNAGVSASPQSVNETQVIEPVPPAPAPKVAPKIVPAHRDTTPPATGESPVSQLQMDPPVLPAPNTAAVQRRPIRPEPPVYVAPRLITVPVLAENQDDNARAPNALQEKVAPQEKVATSETRSSAASQPPTQRRVVAPVTTPKISIPSIASDPYPVPVDLVAPATPSVTSNRAALVENGTIPSYARVGPQATHQSAPVTAPQNESRHGMPVRPERLGVNTVADSPSDLVMPDSESLRPARLGSSSTSTSLRPAVEMANRPTNSNDGVIRQPSSGLK